MTAHLIRPAVQDDAAPACALLRRSIVQSCIKDHRNDSAVITAWLENKTLATVAAWFSSPANFPAVAINEGKIVGVALLTRLGKIALCHVDPEWQGSGTGLAMHNFLEEQAREWGIDVLRVDSTLTAAPFYLHQGFNHLGSKKTAYGTRALTLAKNLTGLRPAARKGLGLVCDCNQTG